MIDDDKSLTYSALNESAADIARALHRNGVTKGDRVAVLARNCVDYARLFFGCARAGAVLVNLSARNSAAENRRILQDMAARYLFHDDTVDKAVAFDIQAMQFGADFEDFAAARDGHFPAPALSPEDPLCMTFTGGTTGLPRGVLVSHGSRCAVAPAIARAFGFTGDDVVCISTPMAHVAGLLVCFIPAVAVGASCVFQPAWDAGAFFELVAQHRITTGLMVPTQLFDIINHPRFDAERLRSIRRIVYAGAPMPATLLDTLIARLPWIEFIENYGQSELGAVTVRRGRDLPAKAGSIGRAIDGVEVAVLDSQGLAAAVGEPGELCCRGVNLLLEYDRDPDATKALFKYGSGWLATGDVAVRDADGFYTLVDRVRDIIICGGENIYPSEVENVLRDHPAVIDCAVFGVPDDRLGEIAVAHAIVTPAENSKGAELVDFCADRLGWHKTPRHIRIVDELPRTAIGKVQRNLLRSAYPNGFAALD